ncbi:hypothetical protein ACET3Z_000377 [Daucus carota]
MATREIMTSIVALIIFLLIAQNNVVMSQFPGNSENQNCIQESYDNKRLVARDAIEQTIHDIHDLIRFINTIPQLKSLPKSTAELEKLKDCVAGLVGNATVAHFRLTKLRHLDDASMLHVASDSKQLNTAMNEAMRLQGQVCHNALEDVDRTITSMLSRKLLDVAVNVNDILYLVNQLKL